MFSENTNAIGGYRSIGYVENGMHPKLNCVLIETTVLDRSVQISRLLFLRERG